MFIQQTSMSKKNGTEINQSIMTYLKTGVGSSLTDEVEWSSDMYLHDNIGSIIGHGVGHLVECEPGVIHDMVDFTSFSKYI